MQSDSKNASNSGERAKRGWRAGLCLTLVLLMIGCGADPSVQRFENYRERLARSLSQPLVDAESVAPVIRPTRRNLRVNTADQRIGLLQFLKLHDCALWQAVGDRNSALGKVAPASQRLFSDLDFLALAPACVALLEDKGEDALAATLQRALDVKREELAVSIWQATFASEEFERLWHVPERLDHYDASVDLGLESALSTLEHWIVRWLDGQYQYEEAAFENALGILRHGNAGFWLRAAALTESELDAANALAASRLDRRPLCFNGQANEQGRILLNVVQWYFVGDVQVWAAGINRTIYRVLAPHQRLEHLLSAVQPPVYLRWAADRDAQLAALQAASRAHVAAIAPLLESCGLLPSAS